MALHTMPSVEADVVRQVTANLLLSTEKTVAVVSGPVTDAVSRQVAEQTSATVVEAVFEQLLGRLVLK